MKSYFYNKNIVCTRPDTLYIFTPFADRFRSKDFGTARIASVIDGKTGWTRARARFFSNRQFCNYYIITCIIPALALLNLIIRNRLTPPYHESYCMCVVWYSSRSYVYCAYSLIVFAPFFLTKITTTRVEIT